MYSKQIIGNNGEQQACEYLITKGYKIEKRNYRCKMGEVDIIAKDRSGELVFVEVKTRKSYKYGFPLEAINYYKKNHILKVAQYYMMKNNIVNAKVRFDAIEVMLGKYNYINHVKQIF